MSLTNANSDRQKVHKQRRIKVNMQSPIPTFLLYCEKMYGWIRLCIFTITFILPCLYTFWHAILMSLFISFHFLSFIFTDSNRYYLNLQYNFFFYSLTLMAQVSSLPPPRKCPSSQFTSMTLTTSLLLSSSMSQPS